MKKLVLIDGHALVHRAFHALPPTLNSPKGVPTNAVFGFTSVLLKMIKDLKPEYIAATFDLAAPTFRHEEFAEYKAHREKAPNELHAQVPLIKEILTAFGIPIYEKPGFEADDLIGALAEKAKKDKNVQTVIMTGDLDTLQLVDGKKVVVFTLKKGVTDTVIYDEDEVAKRYGLKPEQLNDFKGLKGDPSDNIPGVPGVGEKTAAALIQTFGNLESLYEAISNCQLLISKKDKEKIKPPLSEKLVQKLLENKDMAFFSKKLSTIIRDVDIDFNLNKADWLKNLNRPEIEKLFKELGLYSLVKRLGEIDALSGGLPAQTGQMTLPEIGPRENINDFASPKDLRSQQTGEVASTKEIANILDEIRVAKEIVFSVSNELINIAAKGQCVSILWPSIVKDRALFKEFKDIFGSKDIMKIGHDLKEIAKFLLAPHLLKQKVRGFAAMAESNHPKGAGLGYGIELDGPGFDTKLAAYLLNSDRKDYSLDRIYFDEFQESINLTDKEKPIFIAKLKEKQLERLKKEKLEWLFENIEVPTARVLAEMELRGILVDSKAIARLSKLITGEISDLEKKIHKLAGSEFNINSPKQLKEILFGPPPGGLNIKGRVRKTAKGALSTAAGELEKLADKHPIIEQILRYREIQKLKTTYIDPFPTLISKTTGRLHTTFNQTGTTTGRLASQDPNLQNVPIKTKLGREFRKAFIASPGFKLVSFDYSQLELRIAAHISQDTKMMGAFKRGEDIHTRTAAEMFGVKPETVDRNMRRDAKVLNFGVLYGMGILGFQRASGVSRERAREFIDRYMKEFSGIARYMNEMKIKARKDGYVTTIFGRRRWLPEIRSSMPQVISQAERMAINHPIQGTATGDLMKLAMINVFDHIHNSGNQDDVFLLLQIHDELLFEVKDDLVKKIVGKLKDIMENVYKLDVPLTVDVNYGDNWAEMEEI